MCRWTTRYPSYRTSVPESDATKEEKATDVVHTQSDIAAGGEVQQAQIPVFRGPRGSGESAENDRRTSQDLVPEQTHQMEVSGVHKLGRDFNVPILPDPETLSSTLGERVGRVRFSKNIQPYPTYLRSVHRKYTSNNKTSPRITQHTLLLTFSRGKLKTERFERKQNIRQRSITISHYVLNAHNSSIRTNIYTRLHDYSINTFCSNTIICTSIHL